MSCPKCSDQMVPGFTTASTNGGTFTVPPFWVAGPPERSMWTGSKVRGKETHPFVAYRCTRCGFVELWAPNDA